MPLRSGNLEFFTGPKEAGSADSIQRAIVHFIEGARESLEILVQELDDYEITRAILAAKRKKVQVRIILDGSTLLEESPRINPYTPGGTLEQNRDVFMALQRSGIMTRIEHRPPGFHQKYIIKDQSAVLLSSANFTQSGVLVDLNHVFVVRSKKVTKHFHNEFEDLFAGHWDRPSLKEEPIPPQVMVSQIPIKILLGPQHQPEMEIMKQLLKAKESVYFSALTWSRSSGIDDCLIRLSKSGVRVRGILDSMVVNQRWAASRPLKNCGIDLFGISRKISNRKLQHKLIVIDQKMTLLGGFDYAHGKTAINDEHLLVMGSLQERDLVEEGQKRQQELANYAISEIERMIQREGEIFAS